MFSLYGSFLTKISTEPKNLKCYDIHLCGLRVEYCFVFWLSLPTGLLLVEIQILKSFVFIVVVPSLGCVQFFAIPWTASCQASLSFTISWSLLKFTSTESVMPSNHLILCHPLPPLPSIFASIRVFSSESALCIMLPAKVLKFQLQHQFFQWTLRVDLL